LDGGQTWGPSYDIINPELSDPEVYDFIEAVFPSMATYVNDTLHILYQQDFFPGYRSVDEDDPLAENFAAYTGVPVSLIPDAASVSTNDFASLEFSVFPNPVMDQLNIILSDKITEQVIVELFNVQGQQLVQFAKTGPSLKLNTSQLNPGFYFLKISSKNQLGYHTIIKTQ
jgi:hypothetical protein